MQRAADMASVMGIDMQSALDSVRWGGKGNFTKRNLVNKKSCERKPSGWYNAKTNSCTANRET